MSTVLPTPGAAEQADFAALGIGVIKSMTLMPVSKNSVTGRGRGIRADGGGYPTFQLPLWPPLSIGAAQRRLYTRPSTSLPTPHPYAVAGIC
jgi:hypothetical protein